MTVATIKAGIETRLGISLPGYTALKYQLALEDNKNKGSGDKWALTAINSDEIEGVTKFITVDQGFRLSLVKSYITTNEGDSALNDKVTELRDDIMTAYADIVSSKAGAPSVVIGTLQALAVEDTVIDRDNKTITIIANFTVTYRVST